MVEHFTNRQIYMLYLTLLSMTSWTQRNNRGQTTVSLTSNFLLFAAIADFGNQCVSLEVDECAHEFHIP